MLRGAWPGSAFWTLASYAVAGGNAAGADAAWIDDVALPPADKKAAFSALLMLLLD